MTSLYADEDFNYGVVERLRRLGHDVLTVQEAGRSGSDDAQVLTDATAAGRVVLTYNRWDFERLHQAIAAARPLAGQHIRVNRPAAP